jgi:transcriptional regulator with XRE-family HTH domain
VTSFDDMYDFAVVRDLRKRAGLTIRELAERSSVSQAVISKLERNQSRAELETLFRLARVFGINTTELLGLAEKQTAQTIVESHHRSDGFTFRQIEYGNLTCLLGTASAGGWVSRSEVHADLYELCWCLEGEIQLTLSTESRRLKSGDATQFDAILEHSYEAVTDCRLLIVHLTKDKRF